jgi:adhesin transport system outer membrane protein
MSRMIAPQVLSICLMALCNMVYATDLQQAVDIALQTYPAVQSQQATVAANADLVRKEKGGYLPSMDVEGGIGRETADNPSTRALDPNGDGVITLTQKESALVMKQLLFDGGKVGGKVLQSKAEESFSQFELAQLKELIAFQAAEAYLNVQKARELVTIQQQNVDIHADIYRKMQRLLDGGAGLRSDMELAQGRLAQAQAELDTAKGNLEDANATYLQIIGQKAPAEMILPEEVTSLPNSLQAAQDKADSINPMIAASESQWDKTQGQVHEAKASFMPTVSFDVAGGLRNDLDGVPGDDNFAEAMVVATYNILKGGSDKAALEAAHANAVSAERTIMTTKREVGNDVALAWDALSALQNSLPDLYTHQIDSNKVALAYGKQFRLGQRTLFDVMNASSEYFDAQTSYVTAKYNVRISQYRLLAAMGNLVSTLHKSQ